MKKINNGKKNVPMVIYLTTLLVVGGFLAWLVIGLKTDDSAFDPDIVMSQDKIGLTETESVDGLPSKTKSVNSTSDTDEDKTTIRSNDRSIVNPVITSWFQNDEGITVLSRVPGVFESGGTCTLKLSKAGNIVSASKLGIANVSEVSCGTITIPGDKLTAGEWVANVYYSSPSAKGSSKGLDVSFK